MNKNITNIIFYSNQCKTCQSLLMILKSENMIQYFKMFCVDDPNVRNNLPKGITKLPTLIVPSMNKKLEASEIFMWLKTIKSSKEQRKQDYDTTHVEPQTNIRQPNGFVSQEMTGISDMYAFTSIDEIPRHSYTACNELDKNTIFTAQEPSKEHQQPAQTKSLEQKRTQQDGDINELFKKQHENIKILQEKRKRTDNLINNIVDKHQTDIMQMLNR